MRIAITTLLAFSLLAAPSLSQAGDNSPASFDFWGWLASVFESSPDPENPPEPDTQTPSEAQASDGTGSIQDESRSFTSIIR